MKFYGHDENRQHVERSLASGRLHHGWILAGPRGLGKAHFALEFARLLVDPEDRHRNLIEHRTHPDIIRIQRLAKETPKDGEEADPNAELKRSITIDQIRNVQHALTTRPSMGPKRVVIIDAADDLERGGANALLKSLEEPPVGTYFFLISHASDRLLPTIRSRCQMLRFDPLSIADMAAALRQAIPEASERQIELLAATGNGSPGQALDYADLDFDEIETAIQRMVEKGDPTNKIRHGLAESLSTKSAQARYEAFLRYVPISIAKEARTSGAITAVEAFQDADKLSIRAIALSLDKQAVIFQMGSLLASLRPHKLGAE